MKEKKVFFFPFPKICKYHLVNKNDKSKLMNENLHEKDILNTYYLKFKGKNAPSL